MQIQIEVDRKTHDLIRTINESYHRDGIGHEVERIVADRIARDYTRDASGEYHRLAELERFAG